MLEYYAPYKGGVERLFQNLCEALAKAGHIVTVLTANYTDLPETEQIAGVNIIRIPARSRLTFTYKAIPAAIRMARNADLVHTTSYNAALAGFMAGKRAKKKVVITFHEYWGSLWWKLPFLRFHQRVLYFAFEQFIVRLRFESIIAVSKHTEQKITTAFPRQRVMCILNGLADKPVSGDPPSAELYFLFVGRLGISKGLEVLAPAAASFLAKHPEMSFKLVISEGPAHVLQFIKRELKAAIQGGQVQLLHDVSDAQLHELMRSSRWVVVPSQAEGFGYVAAEACALGVPVVHSGRGALPEVVNGPHIEMSAYSREALQEALGRAASGHFDSAPAKSFPVQKMAEEYQRLYAQLIS